MKTRTGKTIAAVLVILLIASIFLMALIGPAPKAAAASAGQSDPAVYRFVGTYTAPYIILRDYNSGYVIDKTTGIAAAGETYAANPITATLNTTTGFWEANIPAMSVNYNVVLSRGDAAVPAYTDTTSSWFYSQHNNKCVDADMPSDQGRLLVK